MFKMTGQMYRFSFVHDLNSVHVLCMPANVYIADTAVLHISRCQKKKIRIRKTEATPQCRKEEEEEEQRYVYKDVLFVIKKSNYV